MSTENVIIKGVRDEMLILLDDSAPWDQLLGELGARLEERGSFFRGASVTINLGDRVIDEPEWVALQKLLTPREIELGVVVSGSTQSRSVAAGHGVRNRAPAFAARGDVVGETVAAAGIEPAPPTQASKVKSVRRRSKKSENGATAVVDSPNGKAGTATLASPLTPDGEPDFLAIATDPDEMGYDPEFGSVRFGARRGWADEPTGALFLRRTLRSGMSVQHDGDVCIFGDVNAGAEIVAKGDVVVWGTLRGLVHAGEGGNQDAIVAALLLAPTQLRIDDIRSRTPNEPGRLDNVIPEIARVEGDRIIVEAWTPRRTKSV